MGNRPSEARIALDMWRAQREGAAGLQRRREARLAALVDHARSRSNFYRDRFRGVADANHALGDLPPVSKPELMDSFDDWVTDPRVDRKAVEGFVADASLVGNSVPRRSWRDVLATSGRRVVWVELGREYRADLDWDAGRPPAEFPTYPSLAYLEELAQGAVARGL